MPWPADFIWKDPLVAPEHQCNVCLVMFFNLECPGCVSRGVPLLKRWTTHYGDTLNALLIHTAYGHRYFPRDEVTPSLIHFAQRFARIDIPIALDLDGSLAKAWTVEGTPHWFLFAANGELDRSIYGSQGNAETRLEYGLEALLGKA